MGAKEYILYHNIYSICSMMVRYTLALRGPPKDDHSAMDVTEVAVDLFKGENLTEEFLCDINKYAQVPVLDDRKGNPVPDSLEITHYIANVYPNVIPKSHRDEITALLKELHGLNFFSLSFTGRTGVAAGLAATVEKLLEDPTISGRYRKALEFKREVVQSSKIGGLKPETVTEVEHRTKGVLDRLAKTLPENPQGSDSGPWLFGLQEPSALDAHSIMFVERMRDVGRLALVPDRLNAYSQEAADQAEFKHVLNGRRTMAPLPKA
ncbi:uncharacterized protein N7482_008325 [Penicillium canariense]|uniref:GST N-terminal domain-containing protein n=1 Tax=Penicillium canariense TaxID=189055 RepID=A0A9W9LIW5_9EURO|nr:uncharacterized protein N7482_008325 [Penicillium canariense]KAJ5157225.1 hypothetical protein N7482_008325 [Penicillium canariense]